MTSWTLYTPTINIPIPFEADQEKIHLQRKEKHRE